MNCIVLEGMTRKPETKIFKQCQEYMRTANKKVHDVKMLDLMNHKLESRLSG